MKKQYILSNLKVFETFQMQGFFQFVITSPKNVRGELNLVTVCEYYKKYL